MSRSLTANRHAFTLIELMVALSLMSFIAATSISIAMAVRREAETAARFVVVPGNTPNQATFSADGEWFDLPFVVIGDVSVGEIAGVPAGDAITSGTYGGDGISSVVSGFVNGDGNLQTLSDFMDVGDGHLDLPSALFIPDNADHSTPFTWETSTTPPADGMLDYNFGINVMGDLTHVTGVGMLNPEFTYALTFGPPTNPDELFTVAVEATVNPGAAAIPEPSPLLLGCMGLAPLLAWRIREWRRRSRRTHVAAAGGTTSERFRRQS